MHDNDLKLLEVVGMFLVTGTVVHPPRWKEVIRWHTTSNARARRITGLLESVGLKFRVYQVRVSTTLYTGNHKAWMIYLEPIDSARILKIVSKKKEMPELTRQELFYVMRGVMYAAHAFPREIRVRTRHKVVARFLLKAADTLGLAIHVRDKHLKKKINSVGLFFRKREVEGLGLLGS